MLFSYTPSFAILTTFVAAALTFSSISPRSSGSSLPAAGKALLDAAEYLTYGSRYESYAYDPGWTRLPTSHDSVGKLLLFV